MYDHRKEAAELMMRISNSTPAELCCILGTEMILGNLTNNIKVF